MQKISLAILFIALSLSVYSQGVAINNSGQQADSSAIMDISSINQGLLIPRMTEIQRNAIANPAEGLLIYNIDTKCINVFSNNMWMEMCPGCITLPAPIAGNNGPLCQGDTVYLTASAVPGATSYHWTGPNGFSSSLQNPVIAGAGVASSGAYYVTPYMGNCAGTTASTSLTVHPIPSASFTNSPSTPAINQNATFYPAVSGAIYSWTFQNGTPSSSSAENPVVIWSSAGTYTVSLTITQNACSATYSGSITVNNCIPGSGSATFSYTGNIQTWTVPACISQITVEARGAQGGNGGNTTGGVSPGGKGARMIGTFNVNPGDVIKVLVGEQGETKTYYVGGGGGGSFVWIDGQSTPLIVAGGGGGAGGISGSLNSYHNGIDAVTTQNGTNGNGASQGGGVNGNGGTYPGVSEYGAGGCGWYTNGANGQAGGCSAAGGGVRPLAGGQGGALGGNPANVGRGGFGGGGGGQGACNAAGGGGGGGYSGGGGGILPVGNFSGGGGGGSYNAGTAQSNTAGYNTGNGLVIITY